MGTSQSNSSIGSGGSSYNNGYWNKDAVDDSAPVQSYTPPKSPPAPKTTAAPAPQPISAPQAKAGGFSQDAFWTAPASSYQKPPTPRTAAPPPVAHTVADPLPAQPAQTITQPQPTAEMPQDNFWTAPRSTWQNSSTVTSPTAGRFAAPQTTNARVEAAPQPVQSTLGQSSASIDDQLKTVESLKTPPVSKAQPVVQEPGPLETLTPPPKTQPAPAPVIKTPAPRPLFDRKVVNLPAEVEQANQRALAAILKSEDPGAHAYYTGENINLDGTAGADKAAALIQALDKQNPALAKRYEELTLQQVKPANKGVLQAGVPSKPAPKVAPAVKLQTLTQEWQAVTDHLESLPPGKTDAKSYMQVIQLEEQITDLAAQAPEAMKDFRDQLRATTPTREKMYLIRKIDEILPETAPTTEPQSKTQPIIPEVPELHSGSQKQQLQHQAAQSVDRFFTSPNYRDEAVRTMDRLAQSDNYEDRVKAVRYAEEIAARERAMLKGNSATRLPVTESLPPSVFHARQAMMQSQDGLVTETMGLDLDIYEQFTPEQENQINLRWAERVGRGPEFRAKASKDLNIAIGSDDKTLNTFIDRLKDGEDDPILFEAALQNALFGGLKQGSADKASRQQALETFNMLEKLHQVDSEAWEKLPPRVRAASWDFHSVKRADPALTDERAVVEALNKYTAIEYGGTLALRGAAKTVKGLSDIIGRKTYENDAELARSEGSIEANYPVPYEVAGTGSAKIIEGASAFLTEQGLNLATAKLSTAVKKTAAVSKKAEPLVDTAVNVVEATVVKPYAAAKTTAWSLGKRLKDMGFNALERTTYMAQGFNLGFQVEARNNTSGVLTNSAAETLSLRALGVMHNALSNTSESSKFHSQEDVIKHIIRQATIDRDKTRDTGRN